jgi:hypothetical protein
MSEVGDLHLFYFYFNTSLACDPATAMSGRILSHRLVPLVRAGLARHLHNAGARTGGLLRADGGAALRGRAWPIGSNGIHNNVPAVRSISFARMLPKLALKLVRIPAMFGGATIAGVAYLQYQATRTSYLWIFQDLQLLMC